ncbi:hypothetical protein NITGR_250027 [Nitrospina gracilis 3/211]|uniref:Response regulatory domain-containing protein n=1 Tax=Nitrospina gracilis (strain 3/211) TaxID=1266370 RepID=M1YXA2_NITG3|nr:MULTISPECIES: hypothetical protein [Nitrospina]MCF8723077.1 DNA-binding NtrC family response regulator [Nitrospina sp. Nb-3]CCQ90114.1 hypothetical protein NITGR_250027 [Nitrospina gracilis 3/211]
MGAFVHNAEIGLRRETHGFIGAEAKDLEMRILILDRNKDYGALLGDLLEMSCESSSLEILHAHSMEEVILSINALNINFAVIEPEVPQGEGMSPIKIVKDHKPNVHVAAVHMSERNPCLPGCRARCLVDGATWHFESPREVNEVIQVIKFCIHFDV